MAQLSLFGEVRLQITTEKVRKYIGSWEAWELVRPLRIWLLQEEKSLSGPLFYAPIEPVFHHCYVLIRGAPWGMHIVLIFGSSVTVREYNHEVSEHVFIASETTVLKCPAQSRYLVHAQQIHQANIYHASHFTRHFLYYILTFTFSCNTCIIPLVVPWIKCYPTPQQELANLHFSSVVKKERRQKWDWDHIWPAKPKYLLYGSL